MPWIKIPDATIARETTPTGVATHNTQLLYCATSTSYRTSYHQLQLNLAYIF
jgi:hypothetical protein